MSLSCERLRLEDISSSNFVLGKDIARRILSDQIKVVRKLGRSKNLLLKIFENPLSFSWSINIL